MSSSIIAGARNVAATDIILAYRHTFKALLRAVQYAQPARFVARDRIRNAFRKAERDDYDAIKISRTIKMLDNAARTRGLEHRIVKNLMHVWWERDRIFRNPYMKPDERALAQSAYKDFDRTIQALNENFADTEPLVLLAADAVQGGLLGPVPWTPTTHPGPEYGYCICPIGPERKKAGVASMVEAGITPIARWSRNGKENA